MALFKIFNNANTKNNLPDNYKAGYCYFDVNTGKFYIDTIDDNKNGRIPISGEMADKLRTARTITLNGDVTGSTTFDGSGDVTITAAVAADSHAHDTQYLRRDGNNTMTGNLTFSDNTFCKDILINGAVKQHRLSAYDNAASNAVWIFSSRENGATNWKSLLTISMNGTVSASTFKGALNGNADTATAFKTAQTITVAGDATGTVTFDGSKAQTLSLEVGSADQLSSNYKINGTAFNGSKDITTASWGAARNVSITDGTNTGTATSMGTATSGSYSLKLPTTIKAALDGNAKTATQLETTRTIGLGGHVTGSASFNGTKDIVIDVTVSDDSHLHTKLKATGFGGDSSAAGLVPDAGGYAKFFYGFSNNTPGSFPANNYANTILAISRHNNANYNSQLGFSSNGSIYYRAENGTAFTDDTEWKKLAFTSDNVASADKWSTARTLTLKGGANGNVTFDGSKNVECEVTITDDSHAHDTQYLRRNGANYMTGNIYLSCSDNDRQICFGTNTSGTGGNRSWRFLYEGTGDGNANYLKIQSSKNTTNTWSNALIFGNDTLDATFGGKVISESGFEGNASSASKWATARTITLTGGATGSVSIDGSENKNLEVTVTNDGHHHSNSTIDSLDASKITSGTISISRLPQGALERLVVVADDTARFKLTTSNVQLGDVVKVTATDVMYFVKDTANLGNANGYELFAAGRAASVNWANIENVPTLKLSGHATGEIDLSGVAASGKVLNVTIADDSHAHNSQYLRRDGANYMSGNIVFAAGNTDKAIEFTSNASGTINQSHSWKIVYEGSKDANNNYLSFQSTKTGTTWSKALYFESETLNATFGGTVTASKGFIGNASTATTLQTARNIGLGGDVTGTATSFNGSADITINTVVTSAQTGFAVNAAEGNPSILNLMRPGGGNWASWRFRNQGGILYFDCNYTSKIVDWYPAVTISYNTGHTTFKGNVTAPKFIGALQGNADTASKWATARKFTLTGDVTGETTIDGNGDISLTTTVGDDSHLHDGRYVKLAGSTLNANAQIKRTGKSQSWINGRDGAVLQITTISGYSPAISIKTVNGSWEIGAYDNNTFLDKLTFAFASDANYTAGTNATNNYTIDTNGNYSGNSATASKWATARTLTLSGDVTGSVTFDGSGDISLSTTVGDDSHLHDGRYVKLAGSTMTGNLVLPVGADVFTNASLHFGTKTRIGTGTNNTFGIYSTGNINLRPNGGTLGYADGIEISTTSVIPTKNNTVTLGDSTHTWKTVYGNATSASKWATARTITVAGDATGSVEIDGSANKTLTLDVATAAKTDYALTVNVTNVADTLTTTTFNGSAAKTININASDFMPLTSFTKTLTLTTSWQDIGISSNNIANSGSYIIQVLVNDGGTTGTLSNYSEYYTGVMSWYASNTNSTDTDEIILHKAGHASNSRYIYLRTVRTSAGTLKMQIAANVTATAASTLVIKVRQLI